MIVAALAGGGAYYWSSQHSTDSSRGSVLIGGPFEMTAHTGERVTEKSFSDQYMLVYFGYTYCPDVCPIGLTIMTDAYAELPDGIRNQIVPIFITVDPERDTVEAVKDYVELFHPDLIGLSGTVEDIAETAKAYRVYYSKVDSGDDEDYLVDHSAFTYLMDKNGEYFTHFSHGITSEKMNEKLNELLG